MANLNFKLDLVLGNEGEKEIVTFLKNQLKDNTKSRIIDEFQKNKYYSNRKHEFNSQEKTYKFYKEKVKSN